MASEDVARLPTLEEGGPVFGPGGTYDPDARHEVERGVGGFYVVQREERSPHFVSWASEVHETVRAAQVERIRLLHQAAAQRGEDQRLRVPGVSPIAFDAHHSLLGGCGDGSVADCVEKKCVERAVQTIDTVLAYREVVADLLGLDAPALPEDVTGVLSGLVRMALRKVERNRKVLVGKFGDEYDPSALDSRERILRDAYRLLGGDPDNITTRAEEDDDG